MALRRERHAKLAAGAKEEAELKERRNRSLGLKERLAGEQARELSGMLLEAIHAEKEVCPWPGASQSMLVFFGHNGRQVTDAKVEFRRSSSWSERREALVQGVLRSARVTAESHSGSLWEPSWMP